jgi:hypothetical protein
MAWTLKLYAQWVHAKKPTVRRDRTAKKLEDFE